MLAPKPIHLSCPYCDSHLLEARTSWLGEQRHEVDLWCPECEWDGVSYCDAATLSALDRELDRIAIALLEELARQTDANMRESSARFIEALRCDLITPDDF